MTVQGFYGILPRMTSLHLIITGRVQGVGFRDWLTEEANRRQLSGWVRNLGEDKVEAVIAGPAAAVEECLRLCWQGPAFARVTHIVSVPVSAPEEPVFRRRSSAA
jgi:acylphosphatase